MRNRKTLGLAAAFALTLGWLAADGIAAEEEKAALGGYCPVAYAHGKAIKGDPNLSSEHDGRIYHFGREEAKKAFDANPARFAAAYDGFCAHNVAHGKKVPAKPEFHLRKGDVTYLFSSEEAKQAFEKDLEAMVAKADEEWPALKK